MAHPPSSSAGAAGNLPPGVLEARRAAAAWEPVPERLRQVGQFVLAAHDAGSSSEHAQTYSSLRSMEREADYVMYLTVLVVSADKVENASLRQFAALMMRNLVDKNPASLSAVSVEFVKAHIVRALGDSSPFVRSAASAVVASIYVILGPTAWPELFPDLYKLIATAGDDAGNLLDGAVASVSEILDARMHLKPEALDRFPVLPWGSLVLPLIRVSQRPDKVVRKHVLSCLHFIVLEGTSAIAEHFEVLMRMIAGLTAQESDPAVLDRAVNLARKLVSKHPQMFCPHFSDAMIEYFVSALAHRYESVRLMTSEFWIDYFSPDHGERSAPTDAARIVPHLPQLLHHAIANARYDEEYLLGPNGEDLDAENADLEDAVEDLPPRKQMASGGGGSMHASHDDGDESDGFGDDDDMAVDEPPMRQSSAALFDLLANEYGGSLLPALLPVVRAALGQDDWLLNEAAVLALGCVADSCEKFMHGQLPDIMLVLQKQVNSDHAFIRSIALWTLGRYASWLLASPDDTQVFRPLLELLVSKTLDGNKRVQRAACTTISQMIEVQPARFHPYATNLLTSLSECVVRYKEHARRVLFDTIITLFENLDPQVLCQPQHVGILMPKLHELWKRFPDDSEALLPLLEVFMTLSKQLGLLFAPFAEDVWKRSLRVLEFTMMAEAQYASDPDRFPEPPIPAFVSVALDMLACICEGLGPTADAFLVHSPRLVDHTLVCMGHSDPEVRRAAASVAGEMFRCGWKIVKPQVPRLFTGLIALLDPRYEPVSNNAGWALGVLAGCLEPEDTGVPLDSVLRLLVLLLTNEWKESGSATGQALKVNVPRALQISAATTIGLWAARFPRFVAQHYSRFVRDWVARLKVAPEGQEKYDAVNGLMQVLLANPEPAGEHFSRILMLADSLEHPPVQLVMLVSNFVSFCKEKMPADLWQRQLAILDPSSQRSVTRRFLDAPQQQQKQPGQPSG